MRQGVLTNVIVGLPRPQDREGRGRRRQDPGHAGDGLGTARGVTWSRWARIPPHVFAASNREEHMETEEQNSNTEQIRAAEERATRAERERVSGIRLAVRTAKLGDAFADKLISEGTDDRQGPGARARSARRRERRDPHRVRVRDRDGGRPGDCQSPRPLDGRSAGVEVQQHEAERARATSTCA